MDISGVYILRSVSNKVPSNKIHSYMVASPSDDSKMHFTCARLPVRVQGPRSLSCHTVACEYDVTGEEGDASLSLSPDVTTILTITTYQGAIRQLAFFIPSPSQDATVARPVESPPLATTIAGPTRNLPRRRCRLEKRMERRLVDCI
jgi:hypothetical protein